MRNSPRLPQLSVVDWLMGDYWPKLERGWRYGCKNFSVHISLLCFSRVRFCCYQDKAQHCQLDQGDIARACSASFFGLCLWLRIQGLLRPSRRKKSWHQIPDVRYQDCFCHIEGISADTHNLCCYGLPYGSAQRIVKWWCVILQERNSRQSTGHIGSYINSPRLPQLSGHTG